MSQGTNEGERIKWVKTTKEREHGVSTEENETNWIQLYFLFNVKLRIDSSKMSVRAHEGLSAFVDEGTGENVDGAGAGASTSTTLTTALPSSTLRTFSASHCLVAEG